MKTFKLIKLLLSLCPGADVNATDEQGLTPLMTAIVAGYPLTVVALLQHADCAVNCRTITGMSALHYAARQGSYGTVQLLLQHGADPTFTTHYGSCSPLSLAVQNGHTEVVQTLVLGCAFVDVNVYAKSDDVRMPVYESLESCRSVTAKLLLIGGYKNIEEIHQYIAHCSSDRFTAEASDLQQILSNSFKSVNLMALYHLCRLAVRKFLGTDIWNKAKQLPLPQKVKDYIAFSDIYQPPELNTPMQIYNFFCDNSREIYELI